MKRIYVLFITVLLLVGCSSEVENTSNEVAVNKLEISTTNEEAGNEIVTESETFIYQSENGDIELPIDPKRIVVLDSSAAGALLLFDGSVVGHETWTGTNPLFEAYLNDSVEVSVDNLEQILALSPDLIVTSSNDENFKELSTIAPTVSFTYGKLNYLDTILEYGKLVNQESMAMAWIETFKNDVDLAGDAFKEKYGGDVSISVFEAYGDEMYLYGDNWGRGTQIVYQEMNLAMTDPVKEVALTDGYYSISAEVVPEYAADLMIFTYFKGSNMAFKETDTWQNIEAVKNGNVLEVPAEMFYMTGPITLTYQLEVIEEFFLK